MKLAELDTLVAQLRQQMALDMALNQARIRDALAIEYTYESNRIEGNTLTLQETQLVVEKGLTISGKPLREHLEAINHREAIDIILELARNQTQLDEPTLKQIHGLILRGIDQQNAGIWRTVPVLISGSEHVPPAPYLLPELMEGYFQHYEAQRQSLHPVVLTAQMHEQLVRIHPFVDGNGRTARLVMNLILVQHGYPIANIKGDAQSRLRYYDALEAARLGANDAFVALVADAVHQSAQRLLQLFG